MAHWFHRNVLKATTNQKFELKIINATNATKKLCRLEASEIDFKFCTCKKYTYYIIINSNYYLDRTLTINFFRNY
jgi:hypothetical protein